MRLGARARQYGLAGGAGEALDGLALAVLEAKLDEHRGDPDEQARTGSRVGRGRKGAVAAPAFERLGHAADPGLVERPVALPRPLAEGRAPVEQDARVLGVGVERLDEGAPVLADHLAHRLITGVGLASQLGVEALHLVQHGVDQAVAGREVEEHGGYGDPRLARHLRVVSGPEAQPGEDGERTLEQVRSPLSYLKLKELHNRGEPPPEELRMSAEELGRLVGQLDAVRDTLERYRDVAVAIADGYEQLGGDVPNMGAHFVN